MSDYVGDAKNLIASAIHDLEMLRGAINGSVHRIREECGTVLANTDTIEVDIQGKIALAAASSTNHNFPMALGLLNEARRNGETGNAHLTSAEKTLETMLGNIAAAERCLRDGMGAL